MLCAYKETFLRVCECVSCKIESAHSMPHIGDHITHSYLTEQRTTCATLSQDKFAEARRFNNKARPALFILRQRKKRVLHFIAFITLAGILIAFGAFIAFAVRGDVVLFVDVGSSLRSRITPRQMVPINKSDLLSILPATHSPTMFNSAAVNQPFCIRAML